MGKLVKYVLFLLLGLLPVVASGQSNAPVYLGPGLNISQLPPANTVPNIVWIVKDASTTSDCSVGGGSITVLCYSPNGAPYTVFVSGVSTGGDVTAHASQVIAHGSNEIGTASRIVSANASGKIATSLIPCNGANQPACLDASSLLLSSMLPVPTVSTAGGVKAITCSGTDKLSSINGSDPVCTADATSDSALATHVAANIAHGSNTTGTANAIVAADAVGKIATSLIPCNGANQPACLSAVSLLAPSMIPAPTTTLRGGVYVETCPGSTKQVGHDVTGHVVCAADQVGTSVTTFLALNDTPDTYVGQANNVLRVNPTENGIDYVTLPPPGSTTWLGLTDTPDAYAGQIGKSVRVNSTESGFEFFVPAAGVTDWLALTDTPNSYSGHIGESIRVNAAANGLEFYTPIAEAGSTTWTGLVDTPDSYAGQAGKYVTVNVGENALQFTTLPAPVTDFLALTDTPNSYSGQIGNVVRVNPSGTGLEFAPPNIVTVPTFLDLPDTPNSYSGQGGRGVRVASGGTALEFYDIVVTNNGLFPNSVIPPPTSTGLGGVFQENCSGSDKVIGYDATGHAVCAADQVGLGALPPMTLPLQVVDGTTAIDLTNAITINDTVVPMISAGGNVVMVANPQLPPGTVDRQRLILQGTSNTNTVTISPGLGTSLTAAVTLPQFGELPLLWDDTTQLWDREIIPAYWTDILNKPNVAVLNNDDYVPGINIDPMHGHTTVLSTPGFADCHLPGETVVSVGAGIEASSYCTESAGVPRPHGTMTTGYSTICGDTGCVNAGEYDTVLLTGSGGASVACTQGAIGSCVVTGGGGGGTPGGSTTQVQYNNAGAFGGISGATTNGTVMTLTSPVLVTPALGTPTSGVLTNATGLPLTTGVTGTLGVGNGGTGITSFGSGVATFLGTPTSANLAAALSDEGGSGKLMFGNTRTMVLSMASALTDGAQCGMPTIAALNTSKPPAAYVICTNNTAGMMSWDVAMPPDWDGGTIKIRQYAFSTTNQNGLTVILDTSGQCVSSGEVPGNVATTGEQSVTLTFGNQTNDERNGQSAAITLQGTTCAANDHLYLHVDINGGTATFANIRVESPVLEYTIQ